MELVFKILAVILVGIAAYFLWQGNGDRAFVSAVLGAVSFFLSIRFEIKKRLSQKEIEESQPPSLLNEFDSKDRIDGEQRTTGDREKANL